MCRYSYILHSTFILTCLDDLLLLLNLYSSTTKVINVVYIILYNSKLGMYMIITVKSFLLIDFGRKKHFDFCVVVFIKGFF